MSGVLSWLDSVAQTHPNEIAYEFNEDSITFLNLKKRAISIGKRIMNYAESKKPIAVMASKSIDTIVAYLMNYLSLCLLFIISLSFLCVKSYLNFGTFGGTSKVIILFLFLIGFSS